MPPSRIQALVCIDFDGTLVDPAVERSFPAELGEFLRALQAQGTAWAISTGRSLYQTVSGLASHGIEATPDFLITSERQLHRRTQFNRWIDVGKWNARCARDHYRVFRSNARFFKRVKAFIESETEARYVANEQEPAGVIATSDEEMEAICRFIDQELARVKNLGYERNSIYLRFGHAAYNKGSVMEELARVLELPPTSIFAAGDAHNDLSMLDGRVARMCACPANAVPAVKDLVTRTGGYVASQPAGAGTLEALVHYFGS